MSNVYGYQFNMLTHPYNDNCTITIKDKEDRQFCNYMTQNYYTACSEGPRNLALSQPGIILNSPSYCGDIDKSSELTIGQILTNGSGCKISLEQRIFCTVPYLGRGSGNNPVLESNLLQGQMHINKKSVNPSSEKNMQQYFLTPLLPNVKQNMTDPNLMIESLANNNWVRGGIATKNSTKDNNYVNTSSRGV